MIIGGKVNSVQAKKLKEEQAQGLSVNMDVKGVTEEGGKLVVEYEYTIKYEPGVAEMVVKGVIYAQEDEASRKAILKEWKENKQLIPAFAEDALTAVNYSATSTGTLLSYCVGLGAPLNIPRIRVEEKDGGKPAA